MNKQSGIITIFKSKKLREKMARGVIASFFGMFVMACSGCGGGGGGSSPAPQAAAQPVVKQIIIDAEGDSTMLGTEQVNGQYVQTANSAPAVLQSLLQKQFGPNVTVENRGSGGSTIADRMNGTPNWYAQPFSTSVKSEPAQIVIGNWALNDSGPQHGESAQQYQSYLVDFVTQARAAGKIVVLEEPNPMTAVTPLKDYIDALNNVAMQMNVPIIHQYQYILSLTNWQSLMSADGAHPLDALYAIKAQREADVIAPIVASLMK